MIHKFWNVKLAQPFSIKSASKEEGDVRTDVSLLTADELREAQTAMEDKVYRIWTVLTAFEESAAACISDMLVHVSEGSYVESVRMADYFIAHVDVLFTAIDELAVHYYTASKEQLSYEREAKMICTNVINFFSLLSHTQESGLRGIGITQELLTLVSGLAQYLKALIRIGLTGALRLYDIKSTAISHFLTQLMQLANKRHSYALGEAAATSDLCQSCRMTCEDQCYRLKQYRWHDQCFACSKCCIPLRDQYQEAFVNPDEFTLLCSSCGKGIDGLWQGFERMTKLQQFSFLLSVSLRRLYSLLNVPDPLMAYYGQINGQAPNFPQDDQVSSDDVHQRSTNPSGSVDEPNESINLQDIKRVKSTHMNRSMTNSHRVAKRSTLMETPSPTTAYVSQAGDASSERPASSILDGDKGRNLTQASSMYETADNGSSNNDIPSVVLPPNGQQQQQQRHQSVQSYTKLKPKAKCYYLAELGALDHFMLKHIAVLYLEEILKDQFTLEELADLIDDRKNSTLWGKFVTSLRAGGNKKMPRPKEGTFGVPLDLLVEKNGVDSTLGAGPTRIRIPAFIDDSIMAMKQMDMSIEGIFRKNGNIRRLKELTELIDRNPSDVDLMNETPVQVAALTKKFLRELPDPLLTFKLHKLFIVAQKLDSEAERKRVMHLACCLLPKPNRDTMEVLFLFIQWVATFAHMGEDIGSKMDITNLATVLAPNILYSKSKDIAKDESFCSIEAVKMLLQYQEEFSTVPEDFVPLLQNLTYAEDDMDLNVRHILKRCEMVMKMKRSHSTQGNLPPALPRQHSSPAAVQTESVNGDQDLHYSYQLSSSPEYISAPPPAVLTSVPSLPTLRSQTSPQLNKVHMTGASVSMIKEGSS
ncbi:uncharacterized protein BYT42DRAFT_281393 [Radiomyces spectabilis]|uniref:uncharacterized protein n=1 Tax=Radiomyces spectabilis TaxID=64574 RepID=UPI00221EF0CA|nr:uncharacterized protein BYT42DRAFT_281393 [Radiomyces spectabilis]KAI8384965.1 hypothetical protein BYT42DRAFT_281393 [Radiomyces spectabilis]